MIKDDQKVKLEVIFKEYERYYPGRIVKAIIERDTYLQALKDMCDNMGLYIDSDSIEENGMNCEEIIGSIKESNGDGCDFIFSLVDKLSGENIIETDEHVWEEETW